MTARDDIRVPFGLAVAMARQPVSMVDECLDEYEAAHRAEVISELVGVLGAETFWFDPRDRRAAMQALLDRMPTADVPTDPTA